MAIGERSSFGTPGEYTEERPFARRSYDRSMTSEATPPPDAAPVDPRPVLEAERARLRDEIAEGITPPDTMTYGSQAAAASQVFAQQRDLALRDRNQQHLAQVEAALARLDAGAYGDCAKCGQPIAQERLEAIPWAAFCIDCQRTAGRG
jgi:RNA polymerase-binding protein DksA